MSRAEFAAALEELERARASFRYLHAEDHPLRRRQRLAAAEAWKAHVRTPKGKPKKVPLDKDGLPDLYRICTVLGDPLVAAYTAQVVTDANALYARLTAERERCVERADKLSVGLEVRKGGTWRHLDQHWASTYSSQGYGDVAYAKQAAEASLDAARAADIEVRVVQTDKGRISNAEILVETPLDVEIVRRLPRPSTREWVRLCWKRGVNPRVFNPWLPAGYEERVGLDYFGGYTRQTPLSPV